MSFARVFIAVAICVVAINGESASNEDTETVIRYLQTYGYLNETMQTFSSVMNQRAFRHALALFQEYYKLSGNGTLTTETLRQMRKPRCGLRDLSSIGTSAKNAMKWPKTRITWNFHLAAKSTLDTTRAAFALWQANSSLSFERDPINPNILISWRIGRHMNVDHRNGESCVSAFDGPGGVLAHASLPTGQANFTSEVHVDQTEPWHIFLDKNPRDKYHLLLTLTHEIGHSLGLSHSQRKDSVMYAYMPDETYPVALSREDVFNIQNLYGAKWQDDSPIATTTTTPTTTTAPSRNTPADLCALRSVDAILLLDSQMYIAHEKYVWSIDLNGKTYGEPISLSTYMKFLPSNFTRISAAYQTPASQLVLFIDNLIYSIDYPDLSLRATWPRTLSDFGLPADARINAAVNTNTGRSYVLYNDYAVGEIDDCAMKVVKHLPVQAIFPGIPPSVTSAFRYIDGNLYFTSERQFYKFKEFTRSVTSAGEFDLQIIGVTCPRDGLLRQLRDLLDRIARIKNVFASDNEETRR